MARSIIFVSAILAMVALVSAAPHHAPLVGAGIGHVGTGDVNIQKSLNDVVDAKNLHAHDIAQGICMYYST
jgi:hypothetical protein